MGEKKGKVIITSSPKSEFFEKMWNRVNYPLSDERKKLVISAIENGWKVEIKEIEYFDKDLGVPRFPEYLMFTYKYSGSGCHSQHEIDFLKSLLELPDVSVHYDLYEDYMKVEIMTPFLEEKEK